jgi:alpha-beta hydrolase superfamily lysophospholipase
MPRRQESLRLPVPDQGDLRGHLSYTDRPGDRAVLYVHGFGSVRGGEKARALEAACERRGWTFAAFDFRGHGESCGRMLDLRCSGLLEDLETAWNELRRRGVERLCLVGSSMGGWAAAWFSVRDPDRVTACACIAPAFDFPQSGWDRLTEAEREAWRRTGRMRVRNQWVDVEVGYGLAEEHDRYPVDRLISEWRTPLLIFHGMRDDVVPYQGSLRLVQAAPGPDLELRLYKEGDHRLLDRCDEMAEAACNFFAVR